MRQSTEAPRILSWAVRGRPPHDAPGGPHPRRRRRPSLVKQWLPTALFAGMVVGLIALLLGIRSMGASSTAAPAPPAAQPAQQTEPVAVAPQAREPLGAPLPAEPAPVPTARIRFSSRPIEPSYTVVANDNLWSIAQKNRTTVEALQSINNLPERATLHIGQKLVIP